MGTCLWGCLCAQEHVPAALPTPARWDLKVSYRQCHSFTITNTGLPETATCKWCTGGWQAATLPQTLQPWTAPDRWGHHNAYLDSGHPVLKSNSWPTSNIAQAQGQPKKPHFDISSSSSPKAPVSTVHPQSSRIGVGGVPQTSCCCRCSHRCHFWSYQENFEMFIRSQSQCFVKLVSPPIGKILTHTSA